MPADSLRLVSAPRGAARSASFWRFAAAPAPGTGRTPVLALAGLGIDGRNFAALAPLAKERDLVLHNLPNEAPRRPGMEGMAAEAWEAFDAAGHAGRPAVVMGSSMGGMVALAAALAAPERTAALILLGTPASWDSVPRRLRAVSRIHALVPRRVYPEVFVRVMLPPFYPIPAEVRSDLRRQMIHRTKASVGSAIAAIRGFDARPLLGSIRVPTLVIQGERDPVVPRSSGAALAAAIPGAAFAPIPGCGHLPQVSHPSAVISLVARFLAERGL